MQLDGAVRLVVRQRNEPSYSANAPVASSSPVIAPVDDLVDVAQHDVVGGDAVVAQDADLLEGARAVLAVGEDRDARPAMGLGRGLEDAPVRGPTARPRTRRP